MLLLQCIPQSIFIFLSETDIFPLWVRGSEGYTVTACFTTTLIHTKALTLLPTIALALSERISENISIIIEIVLTMQTHCKCLWGP